MAQRTGEEAAGYWREDAGEGRPVRGSLIEIWQANAAGRYDDPKESPLHPESFSGLGRSGTDARGHIHLQGENQSTFFGL